MRKGGEKLRTAMGAKQQGRLDGFFKAGPTSPETSVNPARNKRLVRELAVCNIIAYEKGMVQADEKAEKEEAKKQKKDKAKKKKDEKASDKKKSKK